MGFLSEMGFSEAESETLLRAAPKCVKLAEAWRANLGEDWRKDAAPAFSDQGAALALVEELFSAVRSELSVLLASPESVDGEGAMELLFPKLLPADLPIGWNHSTVVWLAAQWGNSKEALRLNGICPDFDKSLEMGFGAPPLSAAAHEGLAETVDALCSQMEAFGLPVERRAKLARESLRDALFGARIECCDYCDGKWTKGMERFDACVERLERFAEWGLEVPDLKERNEESGPELASRMRLRRAEREAQAIAEAAAPGREGLAGSI